jgi:hypothetical protein
MKKFLPLLVLFFVFAPAAAHAVKLAPFPDKKSLQPIPEIAHPNISGNVQRGDGLKPQQDDSGTSLQSTAQESDAGEATSTPLPQVHASTNYSLVFVVIGAALAIVAIFAFSLSRV